MNIPVTILSTPNYVNSVDGYCNGSYQKFLSGPTKSIEYEIKVYPLGFYRLIFVLTAVDEFCNGFYRKMVSGPQITGEGQSFE